MPAAPDRAGLARPLTPLAFRALNRAAGPAAPRIVPLQADRLVAAARKRTGLHDLGGDHVLDALDVLARALEHEACLHPVGRLAARRQLVDLLATRLRVQDLLERRPEILDERIDAPIVVLGMPRTGTTFLQRLLAQDRGLRSLPYWEALAPLPGGDAAVRDAPVADRVRRAEQGLRFLHWAAPLMLTMHEMEATAADEEIWLLAIDFATMLFEASYHVPSFASWYRARDLRPGYAYLRTMLQVLQWYRPAPRWLLKSPQHLEQLPALLDTFPDATVVQLHRDPVTVTASFCSMVSYGRRMNSDRIVPAELGAYWAARIEGLLRRSVEDRPPGDGRFVDVGFEQLVSDPLGVVRLVYAAAGSVLGSEAEAAMRSFLAANPRAKHGSHTYRLADFGLDEAERRAAFAFYHQRFRVPVEPAP